MMRQAIEAAAIFSEGGIKTRPLLLIEDDCFAGFLSRQSAVQQGIPIHTFPGSKILPGLFDSHIHGALKKDTMDGEVSSLHAIGEYLLAEGTTSWLPTTVTMPLAAVEKALHTVAAYVPAPHRARVFGSFVEGPYFTAEHRGAHPEPLLRELSQEEFDRLCQPGTMRAIAIAPEKKGAVSFIVHARKKGIRVSLGHSSASYDEAMNGFEAGADAAVHTFCGMSPLHHRSPNLLGAALTRDDVYTEIIADGIHVQQPVLEILLRCKPKEKVILISDAISSTGLPDGEYMLGVEAVHMRNGISRTDSGALAGSTTVLLAEVRRLILEMGHEPLTVVHMASLNPSRRYGLDGEIGSIRQGKKADFLVVNDRYELQEVWKDGQCVVKK